MNYMLGRQNLTFPMISDKIWGNLTIKYQKPKVLKIQSKEKYI